MTQVFADSGYWIAVLNAKDTLHDRAYELSSTLTGTPIITSEWVLTEVLNDFASRGFICERWLRKP